MFPFGGRRCSWESEFRDRHRRGRVHDGNREGIPVPMHPPATCPIELRRRSHRPAEADHPPHRRGTEVPSTNRRGGQMLGRADALPPSGASRTRRRCDDDNDNDDDDDDVPVYVRAAGGDGEGDSPPCPQVDLITI